MYIPTKLAWSFSRIVIMIVSNASMILHRKFGYMSDRYDLDSKWTTFSLLLIGWLFRFEQSGVDPRFPRCSNRDRHRNIASSSTHHAHVVSLDLLTVWASKLLVLFSDYGHYQFLLIHFYIHHQSCLTCLKGLETPNRKPENHKYLKSSHIISNS